MAKLKQEDILKAVEEMSVLELSELVKALEEKFGVTAEEKGYVSSGQLLKAYETQVEENLKQGKHRFIGSILLEQGYMTRLQINEVLVAIGEESMEGLL